MTRMTSWFGPKRATLFVATLSLVVLIGPGTSRAQTTDITSSGLNTQVSIPTTLPDSTINITGGTRPGNGPNLFHSFGEFSVATNNIANFLNETALPTSNILSRVTGGNPSNIFGTLQTTNFGAANLYLLNPAGVMFGPNATLNVGGSFAASTADYLKMTDGATFSTNPAQPTVLSLAPVAAFGFLGSIPASIMIQGSFLQVPTGQTLSLVGGDITMVGGALTAPSGQINLASVASAGEVVSNPPGQSHALHVNSFTQLGQIQMSQVARIDASGNLAGTGAGGAVVLRGGRLTLDNSFVQIETLGSVEGGNIIVNVAELAMTNEAKISSSSTSTASEAGNAGSITIQGLTGLGSSATSVRLDHSTISTEIVGGSSSNIPATIDITAQTVDLTNGTRISADTSGAASAGDIALNVDTLTARPGTELITLDPANPGEPPSMTGNLISSTSTSKAPNAGNAGSISIQGNGAIGSPASSLSLNDSTISTNIREGGSAATTRASIDITAKTVTLTNAARIESDTRGAAPAGNITFNVDELTTKPGTKFIEGSTRTGVSISSRSGALDTGAGPGGKVTIQGVEGPGSAATSVSLDTSSISTFIKGGSRDTTRATVTIMADSVAFMNTVLPRAKATIVVSSAGAAPAGDIALHVNRLRGNVNSDGTPIEGARRVFINSINSGINDTAGPAGTVTISGLGPESTDAVSLVALHRTRITSSVEGGTAALTPGEITITADTMTLTGETEIFARTTGAAPGGNIAFHVDTLRANVNPDGTPIADADPVSIRSDSDSSDGTAGQAGTVTISGLGPTATDAASLVALDNTQIITTVKGGSATTAPSTITTMADRVVLRDGVSIEASTFGAAPAGNVAFHVNTLRANVNPDGTPIADARRVFIRSESTSSESTAGQAGSVTISGLGPTATDAAKLLALDRTEIGTTVRGGMATTDSSAITMTADTVALTTRARILASTSGAAPAGDVALHVDTLRANVNPDGTPIADADRMFIRSESTNSESTAGPAGSVTISGLGPTATDAASLLALDRTEIGTTVRGGMATTDSSAITMTADTVALTTRARILASTSGAAPAGDVALHVDTLRANVNPDGTPRVDAGQVSIRSESDSADGTAGQAGTATISGLGPEATDAASLLALDRTEIGTTVKGGTAATAPGTITMTADTLRVTNSGNIKADTSGAAPAGNIAFNAANLSIDGATKMSSSTSGTGLGGDITITGSSATIGGTIASETSGTGSGGAILVNVGTAHLTNDANLSSRSTSEQSDAGDAGQIMVVATETFQSDGGSLATSAAQGKGGPITIRSGNVVLANETLVSAESAGSKDAGSIALTSTTDLLMRNSTVSTESANASGGGIKLTAPNIIRLVDSTLTSSVQGQRGSNGGNITIDPQLVVIQNSQLLANANAGAGGEINIDASGAVLVDPNSLLSATAGPAGVSGTVNINAPIQVLSGALVPLNLAYSQAALSGDRCAADPTGQFSSFVQTGRDGVPQVPGALAPSPLSFLETLTSGSLGSQAPNMAAARLGLDSMSIKDSTPFWFHSACRS